MSPRKIRTVYVVSKFPVRLYVHKKQTPCSRTVIIAEIHDLVIADGRLKVREIAGAVGISSERVHYILHQHLNEKIVSARCTRKLRLLTVDKK